MRNYIKAYVITLLLACGALGWPFFASLQYLKKMGEIPLPDIVQEQLRHHPEKICLFGSALVNGGFNYKTELYDKIQPEVVGLGSSRVLNFRSDMFKGTFLSLGGAFNSLSEGEALVKHILGQHKPKFILFGIDFWWFNGVYLPASYRFSPPSLADESLSPITKMLKVLTFLSEGKVTFAEVFGATVNPFYDNCHLGIPAKKFRDGFGPDGSYYYGGYVFGLRKADDQQFKGTLNKIRSGIGRFCYDQDLDPVHVATFERIVAMLQASGVPTVYFFPPLPKVVVEEMAKFPGGYAYFSKLRKYVKDKGLVVYDFTDMTPFGGTDCEFLEGIHGGDVLYAKMLHELVSKDEALKKWVDMSSIDGYLSYSGNAMKPVPQLLDVKEGDFLGLGCVKK